MNGRKITRADLEGKLRQIQDAVDETAEQARNAGLMLAVGVVVVILLSYLLGRRKGKKTKGARVEVFRL